MWWPFKTETRAADDYTEQAINAAEVEAIGGTLDAGTLGVAESCMGLWERSLASAMVEPMNGRLAALDPPFLALVAGSRRFTVTLWRLSTWMGWPCGCCRPPPSTSMVMRGPNGIGWTW